MQTRILTVVVCAGALAFAGQVASADVLVLKNGNREQGVLMKETPQGYWFSTGAKMKVFYGRAEVERIERESAETNREHRQRQVAASHAAMEDDTPAADQREDAAVAGMPPVEAPSGGGDDSDILPKAKRAQFIREGGIPVGAATKRHVRGKLGEPDNVVAASNGHTIWQYDTASGDLYAIEFRRDQASGQVVVAKTWLVSDPARRARQRAKRTGHP